VLSIRLIGEHPTDFALLDEFYFPKLVGGFAGIDFNITFRPSAEGVRSAMLQIIIPLDTFYIQLIGNGALFGIEQLSELIHFGNVYIDDYKDTIVPLAINRTDEDLDLLDVFPSGTLNNSFKILDIIPKNGKLKPNDTLFVSVRFIPMTIGRKNAIINLQHNHNDYLLR